MSALWDMVKVIDSQSRDRAAQPAVIEQGTHVILRAGAVRRVRLIPKIELG